MVIDYEANSLQMPDDACICTSIVSLCLLHLDIPGLITYRPVELNQESDTPDPYLSLSENPMIIHRRVPLQLRF